MNRLPEHITIIMDGNGRWARKRFLPRVAGHRAGVETAKQIIKYCAQQKIKVLSLFAFSSENWRRPLHEVNYLMELFLTGLNRDIGLLQENHIALRFIGNRQHFSEPLREKITEIEALTAAATGMTLIIAADYGGKWDVCQAAQKLFSTMQADPVTAITPEMFEKHLSFSDLPDPDLFIRTSGEYRISNFMLWQLAYTELYFTETLWPDFAITELDKALTCFAKRERRYGQASQQISA